MSKLLIRQPRQEDEPRWRSLWAAYLAFYGEVIPEAVTHHTWERILARDGKMFGRLAVRDGSAVGFAICVLHEASWSVLPTCYLEDLFVEPSARSAGIGRALLDGLVALREECEWSSLCWHTRADNAQARKLYDRYGSADDFVRYRLKARY